LVTGPVRRKDGYEYVAEKMSNLPATDGKKLPTETVPCTCGKYVWKG
jgi:hypothetical protein